MAIWHCEGKLIAGTGITAQHMAYFNSQAERENWFASKAIGSFTEYSYIRADKESKLAKNTSCIHIDKPYDYTTEIDYVMYRNNDVYSRWFYGRVTHREYVNINSTRLHFDIDWYSTYSDKLTLNACYIERTHIKKSEDWKGELANNEYLLPEPITPMPLEIPDTLTNISLTNVWEELKPGGFVVYATTDTQGGTASNIDIIGGVHTSLWYEIAYTLDELNEIISRYLSNGWGDKSVINNIIAITWIPKEIIYSGSSYYKSLDVEIPERNTFKRTDGKVIQNAKCMHYPYNFMTVKTFTGEQMVIKYEESTNRNVLHFYLQGVGGLHASCTLALDIKDKLMNYESTKYISFPEYPQIPIPSDAYAQWNATQGGVNKAKSLLGVASITLGTLLALSGYGAGAGASLIGGGIASFSNATAERAGAMSLPDTLVGASNSLTASALDQYRAVFYLNKISQQDLTSVDDFFNCYGYNISQFKVPTLNVRKYFTYVKTKGASVTGTCPSEAIEHLTLMLNNGCTFWNCINTDIGVQHVENPDI